MKTKTLNTDNIHAFDHTLAKLSIPEAGYLSMEARKNVADWLRGLARDLTKKKLRYSNRFTARFLTGSKPQPPSAGQARDE